MKKINLNGIWLGKCIDSDKSTEFSFNATVPGCVHSDLKGIRIPEDIYYRDNTDKCQWIEEKDWEYSKVFRMEQKPKTAKLSVYKLSDKKFGQACFARASLSAVAS